MTAEEPRPPARHTPSAEGGEWAPADDSVIGRAFRWSLVALLTIGLGAAAWLVRSRATHAEPVRAKDLAIPAAPQPVGTPPRFTFADVTQEAGIDFRHTSGAVGDKFLPETMGSGAAFFDADGDGDADLLLANGRPWTAAAGAAPRATPRLYLNDGHGHFTDGTRAAGLGFEMYGTGVAAADFDGDGDEDLFLAGLGGDRLLTNAGGRFVDATEKAGVASATDDWSTCAGAFDYDRDGDLDLFVCRYVRWSPAIDRNVDFQLAGLGRAYGPPFDYPGAFSKLFRNDGGGHFTDVSGPAGIEVRAPSGQPLGKALGVSLDDVDRDGWPDVLVANDTVRNFLFRNRGDGTFEERGVEAGVAFGDDGRATGAMGIDSTRFGESLVVAIGNFALEPSSLFVQQSTALSFVDQSAAAAVAAASRARVKFGMLFLDLDLDGRPELLAANGHIEDQIARVQPTQSYAQPAQLFWNAGGRGYPRFNEVEAGQLGELARPIVGRAATYADIDGDGDLDVLLTAAGGEPLLVRNDTALGHHWLRVRLDGAGMNRDAIGAEVELVTVAGRQVQVVRPTRSYLSQVERTLTFGLGADARVDSLAVRWPDGTRQSVDVPAVDTLVALHQPPSAARTAP